MKLGLALGSEVGERFSLARTDWAIIAHTPAERVPDTVRDVMDRAREAGVRFA